MKSRYILVVSLWLRNGDVAAFEDFERRASKLLARHNGRIEHVIRPLRTPADVATPFEIHIVSFVEPQAYEDYRSDPDVQKLAVERDTIISKTSVLEGYTSSVY